MDLTCLNCGRSPAVPARFDGAHGIPDTEWELLVNGPLCHDCGLAAFRNATEWQVSRGWASFASLVLVPASVIDNIGMRHRVARLPRPANAVSPDAARTPLDAGRPLLLRWRMVGIFVPVLGVVVAIATLVGVVHANQHPPFAVGTCFQTSGTGEPFQVNDNLSVSVSDVKHVDCGEPHNLITTKVSTDCGGSPTLTDHGNYYCAEVVK